MQWIGEGAQFALRHREAVGGRTLRLVLAPRSAKRSVARALPCGSSIPAFGTRAAASTSDTTPRPGRTRRPSAKTSPPIASASFPSRFPSLWPRFRCCARVFRWRDLRAKSEAWRQGLADWDLWRYGDGGCFFSFCADVRKRKVPERLNQSLSGDPSGASTSLGIPSAYSRHVRSG